MISTFECLTSMKSLSPHTLHSEGTGSVSTDWLAGLSMAYYNHMLYGCFLWNQIYLNTQ